MLRNFWKERPAPPVILAWMTAGVLAAIFLGAAGWTLFHLFTFLF